MKRRLSNIPASVPPNWFLVESARIRLVKVKASKIWARRHGLPDVLKRSIVASWLKRSVTPSLPELSPYELGRGVYHVQHAYIGTKFSLLRDKALYERLNRMYSVNQWIGDKGLPGLVYFKHALKCLPDVHEDREYRRRAWWSTYSLEQLLCVISSHQISTPADDIDLHLPSPTATESGRASAILICYTKLSRTRGIIGEDIYRTKQKSDTGLPESVKRAMRTLSGWFDQLPEEIERNRLDLGAELSHESRLDIFAFLPLHQHRHSVAPPVCGSEADGGRRFAAERGALRGRSRAGYRRDNRRRNFG
ncbi:hypothetical protein DL769_011431 [Monosporascus sp. CRB-8-3]|nr:hypothetical protein DL769_011431 [Monosporascus sp. CRB-8-3]